MMNYCCENCGRSQSTIEIERYVLGGYTANLCPTCAYVLVDEQRPERFIALCNRPMDSQTNHEMKKLHVMLSRFILVGVLFITIIAAMAVVQLTAIDQVAIAHEEVERLSFSLLNKLDKN